MDEIRTAVVGLGHRALHWTRLLQGMPGYRVVALCDPIRPILEQARESVQNAAQMVLTPEYEEVLADPRIDAVALGARCR